MIDRAAAARLRGARPHRRHRGVRPPRARRAPRLLTAADASVRARSSTVRSTRLDVGVRAQRTHPLRQRRRPRRRRRRSPVTLSDYINTQFDPALSWDDVDWLRSVWDGPIVVKGIQTVDDAVLAADAGVDAIALSNHGGRQLDGAPAASRSSRRSPMPSAAESRSSATAACGAGSDIVEGGRRRCHRCMAGRAYLYALGAGGEQGVDRSSIVVRDDVHRTMSLVGAGSVEDLDRSRPQPRRRASVTMVDAPMPVRVTRSSPSTAIPRSASAPPHRGCPGSRSPTARAGARPATRSRWMAPAPGVGTRTSRHWSRGRSPRSRRDNTRPRARTACVRGNDGSESEWSEPLVVEAALLWPGDWSAAWITPIARDPLDRSAPTPFLRREFTVDRGRRTIERARLYVTSAGLHHVELNGRVVGDHARARVV